MELTKKISIYGMLNELNDMLRSCCKDKEGLSAMAWFRVGKGCYFDQEGGIERRLLCRLKIFFLIRS